MTYQGDILVKCPGGGSSPLFFLHVILTLGGLKGQTGMGQPVNDRRRMKMQASCVLCVLFSLACAGIKREVS